MPDPVDAMTRGVILRERYIKGTYTRIVRLLIKDEARLISRIEKRLEGLTGADRARFQRDDWTTQRLIALRESIQALAGRYRSVMNTELRLSARELIGAEIQLASQVASGVLAAEIVTQVSEYQVYTAAMAQPFNGRHLRSYMAGVEQGVRRRVLESLRMSFSSGESIPDAVKAIRGTRAAGYTDGIMDISRRSAQMLARTTMTHFAARTQEAVYKDLGIEKAMFLATLDSRTTYGCAALDQTVWPIEGKRPSIPRHLNCRSAWIPHINDEPLPGDRAAKGGAVAADTNFDKWLANQPDAFQREWLGRTRYKLWKDGKPLKKFIDPRFREYSAAELQEKYKLAA